VISTIYAQTNQIINKNISKSYSYVCYMYQLQTYTSDGRIHLHLVGGCLKWARFDSLR